MNRIIFISFFFVNFIFVTILKNSYAYELWTPPWHNEKLTNSSNHVQRTDIPFVFKVFRLKNFPTENEAVQFCKKQAQMITVEKINKLFKCRYYEKMDISNIVPESEKNFWSDPKAQYALYIRLIRNYEPDSKIENKILFKYQSGTCEKEADLKQNAGSDREIIEKLWKKLPNGKKELDYTYRKPVDLLGEARKKYETIEMGNKYHILENINNYKILGPGGPIPIMVDGIKAKGMEVTAGFLKITGGGAVVFAQIADEDNGLDHEYLRHFINMVGVNIKSQKDGQVIVESDSGSIFTWKVSPRIYYRIAGGDHVIFDAYLKKFPSILPKDYKVDEKAWKQEEVRMCIERLREDAKQKQDKDNIYMKDYIYLTRFVEPILGAPLAPPWKVKITAEDRAKHFRVISQWWEKNKDKLKLRPGRPLSHKEALHLIPESNMESAEVALKKFREGISK